MIFKLGKYYFSSCSGGMISLHFFTPSPLHWPSLLHSFTPSLLHSFTPSLLHSFTPSLLHSFTLSLLHFPLGIWKPRWGTPIWNRKGCLSENMNLIPKGDWWARCLSFIRPRKDTTQNRRGSITSHCSRKDPACTCRPDSRTQEISKNQAWQQKLNESVSFIIISSSAP